MYWIIAAFAFILGYKAKARNVKKYNMKLNETVIIPGEEQRNDNEGN